MRKTTEMKRDEDVFDLFPHHGDLFIRAGPTIWHLQHKKERHARQMPTGGGDARGWN